MAGVTQYILKGGPCDGRTGQLSPAIDQSGQIDCQGHVYKRDEPVKIDGGREVFADAGAVPAPPPQPGTPHTHKGWADLQHSFNVNLHKSLQRSDANTAAAWRSLSRASKVRV